MEESILFSVEGCAKVSLQLNQDLDAKHGGKYALEFTSGDVTVECPFVYLSARQSEEQAAKLKALLEQNTQIERAIKERSTELDAAQQRCRSLQRKVEGRRATIDKCKREGMAAAQSVEKVKELEQQMDAERSQGGQRCNLFAKRNDALKKVVHARDNGKIKMIGVAGELGCIDDPKMAETVGRLMGLSLQLVMMETQDDVVKFKSKFNGIRVVALETVQRRWAKDSDVDMAHPQQHLKMNGQKLPEGATYAVNNIVLTNEQMKLRLRQKVWYFLLHNSIVFERADDMNKYIMEHGLRQNMIALDTFEKCDSSGIQQGVR